MAARLQYPFGNPYTIVEGTTALTGTWAAIVCAEATAFATITDATQTVSGTLSSVTFAAGTIIYGSFTNFTLASGAVIAYDDKVTSG